MNVDRKLEDCEIFLNQIKQYDPDPYYVNHYFEQFIATSNEMFDGIFEDANRDFGLYVGAENTEEKFAEIAVSKNDKKAIEFSEWFASQIKKEHENPFPKFLKGVCDLQKQSKELPKIKIMLRPKERYKDDIFQEIDVRLSQGKLSSKKELEIEISRQLPVFLEVINFKRKSNNEPKVSGNQVVASAFMDLMGQKDVEIAYAVQVYIPVMKRILEESRKKIVELTSWK